jgi:sarcosine oxidase
MESYDVVVIGLGALGSSAAMHLARRGKRVLGLERFELGHRRGASHDSSRILRHSYHTPAFVRLTQEAYADWAALERWSGEQLVTVTGGLDLFPPDPAIPMVDYTSSLTDVGIPFELLDVPEIGRRWPQFSLPSGTVGLYQERGAIVPAARTTALMQKLAVAAGAELRGSTQVLALSDSGGQLQVELEGARLTADRAVVCADAWTNEVLAGIDVRLPLETTLEQATYFAPSRPGSFAPHHLPLWIWMDDPSFYGFPCYGEPTVKAAQDCGGPVIDTSDPLSRTTDPDPEMLERMASFMRRLLPESGDPVRSIRCQYTLTPDRDFVLATVPGHEAVSVGLGAAHAFKFAPTFGRILADLATSGTSISDISAFRLDRAALTDPAYQTHWLV